MKQITNSWDIYQALHLRWKPMKYQCQLTPSNPLLCYISPLFVHHLRWLDLPSMRSIESQVLMSEIFGTKKNTVLMRLERAQGGDEPWNYSKTLATVASPFYILSMLVALWLRGCSLAVSSTHKPPISVGCEPLGVSQFLVNPDLIGEYCIPRRINNNFSWYPRTFCCFIYQLLPGSSRGCHLSTRL